MKKITLLLALSAILFSCRPTEEGLENCEVSQPSHSIMNIASNSNGSIGTKIYIYVIDTCEYIGSVNRKGQGDFLAHKENCKYCLWRKNK